MVQSHKVSISLPEELLKYADSYRKNHGLASRSEVLAQALKMLREAELAQGYKDLAAEYREQHEPLLSTIGAEGLEPSDETNW